MLHLKQWHYSLHRDFQNCYSTQRSPTGFFSSNSTILQGYPSIHIQPTCAQLHYITSREFSIQNPILHTEDKELFEYYFIQGVKGPSFQKRNSTHRRQGDLLEIHPCVLQDIPGIPAARPSKGIQLLQTFQSFQTFQTFQSSQSFQIFESFMTFQPFQAILQILQSSSISRESNPFQYSPIRMHILQILQFDWFPQKLHRVPVWQLQTFLQTLHSSKKGRCCDIG